MELERKLQKIFDFLTANRKHNKEVQERFYISSITPFNTPKDRIINLLYNIANTQSQPKIDKLAEFYQKLHSSNESLNSFIGFVQLINDSIIVSASYIHLFEGMKNQSGCGDKTAALLSKSILHLHNNDYSENLRIWDDAPATISPDDNFYLPVDAVIITIFNHLDNSRKWNFTTINKLLKDGYKYSMSDIEIWDDLWFWGFITQKTSDGIREMAWNANKYWALQHSNKNSDTILAIKQKAEMFLEIINFN